MRAISLPFQIDGYGKVGHSSTPEKIYSDRVKVALLTSLGERVMRPRYGSQITTALFDDIDDVEETLFETAAQVFNEWLPELNLSDVETTSVDELDGTTSVTVHYSIGRGTPDGVLQATTLDLAGGVA